MFKTGLTEQEKESLRAVIKPFRDKIKSISKLNFGKYDACIVINLLKGETSDLPSFDRNSVYKGLELNKKYTLEELGLNEG